MIDTTPDIGLYSIGVRDMALPDLLPWAADADVPFLHLRGGVRGCRVLERPRSELERWREIARTTCPITLVTSDVTLNQLASDDPRIRTAALGALDLTYQAASLLGARQVRVLAGGPVETIAPVQLPHSGEVTLLVELHHPWWWTAAGITAAAELVQAEPGVRLLADTAQAAAGLALRELDAARLLAARVIELSAVLHLSDNGSGLGSPGHAILAEAARSVHANLELGFEWTGEPRTPGECLRRYRVACNWWCGLEATHRKGEE
jgi:hypothetical protein